MSSEYFRGLDNSAQQRYQDKLSFEGQQLPDPLDDDVVQFSFSASPRNFPPVTAADIFMYLVEGVCFYTKEQFKNHKLSDAYNAFLSGKVKRVMSFKAGKRGVGVVILTASVEASQLLSKTYRPWCVVKDDGTVVSAHCTCIAGLGECCTHVAALLFNIEAAIKYGLNDPSPTETACRWSEVSRKSMVAPVSEINFFKAKPGQQVPEPAPRQQGSIPTWSSDKIHSFLQHVKTFAPSTLVLSCITDSESTDSSPETAAEERKTNHQHYSSRSAIDDIYSNIDLNTAKNVQLSNECCEEIEQSTRGQSRTLRWTHERKGRITASVLHRVLVCRSGVNGIVAEIMGYVKAPRVSNICWASLNASGHLDCSVLRDGQIKSFLKFSAKTSSHE
ncbi:uncharacterized protein LOC119445594 [Dermacentor silvarum]|uniref:uncharacterized protein LOC119453450 n=1 Tax=Dermacentor silvarum TaxID=543639 RepID=UPI002101A038|nr:uncharacterized protein LOC119453450 [Dermacentor silvarum]XP_037576859.2 uncharacterized protein LOC119459098 [Dermacentor silvarum]XP_049520611.1 uncharacterized protein LOC119445594 [Dermacentor silvarum]